MDRSHHKWFEDRGEKGASSFKLGTNLMSGTTSRSRSESPEIFYQELWNGTRNKNRFDKYYIYDYYSTL